MSKIIKEIITKLVLTAHEKEKVFLEATEEYESYMSHNEELLSILFEEYDKQCGDGKVLALELYIQLYGDST